MRIFVILIAMLPSSVCLAAESFDLQKAVESFRTDSQEIKRAFGNPPKGFVEGSLRTEWSYISEVFTCLDGMLTALVQTSNPSLTEADQLAAADQLEIHAGGLVMDFDDIDQVKQMLDEVSEGTKEFFERTSDAKARQGLANLKTNFLATFEVSVVALEKSFDAS